MCPIRRWTLAYGTDLSGMAARPINSSNQRPKAGTLTNGNGVHGIAPVDESPEELTKRCEAIMAQVESSLS
jgi:hypothetical protein